MKYRIEFDSIGKIKVPGDKYWGASTERSNKYFNIGDFLVRPLVIPTTSFLPRSLATSWLDSMAAPDLRAFTKWMPGCAPKAVRARWSPAYADSRVTTAHLARHCLNIKPC